MKLLYLFIVILLFINQIVIGDDLQINQIPLELQREYNLKLKKLSIDPNENQNQTDSIIKWLIDDGYLDAKSLTVETTTRIIPSERYLLKEVIFDSTHTVKPDGNISFKSENIENIIENYLNDYYDKGYFYARAKIQNISRTKNNVTVHATIIKGPLVLVGSIVLEGLHNTNHKLLKKYIRLKPGDSLTNNRISQAERDLFAIPFISFQSPIKIKPRAGYTHSDLIINFLEKKRFMFSGGVGYLPESEGKIVWDLDIMLRNIFGGGKSVILKSEHRDQNREKLDLSYIQPQFLIGVGEFSFNVATRDYRDEFYEFGVDIGLKTRLKQSNNAGLILNWRRVDPSDLQTNSLSYSAYSLTVKADRSWLDNRLNPRSGGNISMSLGYINRRNSINQSQSLLADSLNIRSQKRIYNETRSKLSLNFFKPLKGKLIGYFHGEYQGLETSDELPPLAEMLNLGGPGTIRGYPNDRFRAQRAAILSIESRIRYESGYLFLFYDGAYINRPTISDSEIITDEIYRDGYGLGISIYDSLRQLKVSLGWNRDSGFNQPRLSIEFSSDL